MHTYLEGAAVRWYSIPAVFALSGRVALLHCQALPTLPSVARAGCGVDGVKVDVQGTSSMFPGGPRVSQQYHKSLEASVAQSFPGNMMINCMVLMTPHLAVQ